MKAQWVIEGHGSGCDRGTYIQNKKSNNMMITDNMRRVMMYIQKQQMSEHDVSPNLVNWMENEMGVRK